MKRTVLVTSFPSVCPHFIRTSSSGRISVKFCIVHYENLSRKIRIWLNSDSGDLRTFFGCWWHKFAIKALLCSTQHFMLLTVICSSPVHRERIVGFPLQQSLRERAAVLCYKYVVHCLCSPTCSHFVNLLLHTYLLLGEETHNVDWDE
jgi:hypothetical protein